MIKTENLMKTFVKKFIPLVFTLSPCLSFAGFDLSLDHAPSNQGVEYTLIWETVEPSTDDASVTYFIYEQFGNSSFNTAVDTTAIATASSATFVTEGTTFKLNTGVGTRCFIIRSLDSFDASEQYSDVECHGFIHHLTSENILRGDGDGSQRGVDQKWKFTYSMDDTANVTARIYPPGTSFTTNSNGFIISASSPIVKTLVEKTPRSGELGTHNITMEESWDSRTSTGVIVPNGIYYLVMEATLDSGYFNNGTPPSKSSWLPNTPETQLRDSFKISIPVDIIRIMNLSATGISLTNSQSSISYFLTGDANVRVVIARPGSAFTVDANGEIQATNRTDGTIDPTLVVSSFTFQRKAGSNSESWDGTFSTGTAVASGVYAVGISANDEFGNHAIDSSGNDFPIFTTITVERTAGSSQPGGGSGGSGGGTTDTTLTEVAAVSINGVAQSIGTPGVFTSPVSTITVRLDDAGGNISLVSCSLAISGPGSPSGTLTRVGTDTLMLTFATPLTTNGTYALSGSLIDLAGNPNSIDESFVLNISLNAGSFENSLRVFPNPAKNANVTIVYDLAVDSTVTIEIFNILGERVYTATQSQTAGTGVQFPGGWNRRNSSGELVGSGLYLMKVKAVGSGATVETIKKVVVIQ